MTTQNKFLLLFRDGTWFRMPRALIKGLETRDAIMLSFLLNQAGMHLQKSDDIWFPVTREEVVEFIGFDRGMQFRSLLALRSSGFIKTKQTQSAVFGERLVRLNFEKVMQLIEDEAKERSPRVSRSFATRVTVVRHACHGARAKNDDKEVLKKPNNVARSACDVGPTGFFGKEQTSFELQAAKRLFDLLAAKRKLFRKVNIKAWAKEFAQLQEGGVDRKRIKAAVKFYSKVIGEDYIPQIYSAKAFCLKFAQLEDAMKKRSSPSGIKGDRDNITVSDEAQRIAEDLGESYPWPKGLGSQLAPVVQKSLDNLREFDAKRKAAVKRWKKLTHSEMAKIAQRAQRMLDFDTEITGGWLSGTDAEFVAAWFANVSKRLAKWKDFNSSLAHFTFSITHADADARGRQEAVEWTGSDEVWTKYVSRINES